MIERRVILVRGTVQGVGFRPFVYGLAVELGLAGLVRNQTGEVHIEVEGETMQLEEFLRRLRASPPPMAIVDGVSWSVVAPRGVAGFRIEESRGEGIGEIVISADLATCEDCLRELFDPLDRRYRYPFLNCTNCGPRLTIVTGAPYDRQRTTMASFEMCGECRREYEDPGNRRFHAQPTACGGCGPRLRISWERHGNPHPNPLPEYRERGQERDGAGALEEFGRALLDGKIGAIKGLGGYHLACDARRADVVAELRKRKERDEKPFAVMVADAAMAASLGEISNAEAELLQSRRRPIVLVRKREVTSLAEAVAPGNPYLGVMLPYTPVHHLLMRDLGIPLVMTSGNRADEPIAHEDEDAMRRLAGIADVFLTHDRAIQVRCDDSVTRIVLGEESPLRRSRGYAPQPIAVGFEFKQPVLAVGGQLKSTFALGSGRRAMVSHHLGDLDHYAALLAFERDVELYRKLFEFTPAVIAHDLHPDYASTRYAMMLAAELKAKTIAVQHHHAHLASCMAEHGLSGEVIGVIFDGTGLGTDETVWGGEFLVGGYRLFRRGGYLRRVKMPGGERAIREPWRMAAGYLMDAGCECEALRRRVDPAAWRTALKMMDRGFNSPLTSSAGRLFDAVATIAGVRDRVSYEGQAAIELEWAAARGEQEAPTLALPRRTKGGDKNYSFDLSPIDDGFGWEVDTRSLIRGVVEEVAQHTPIGTIANRMHETMAAIVEAVCVRLRKATEINRIVLSGGVFMNRLFTERATGRLTDEGFAVYRQRIVPPNDGGLSLGQLAVAAALIGDEKE